MNKRNIQPTVIILALAFLFIFNHAHSTAPGKYSDVRFGGTLDEELRQFEQTLDNGFIYGGSSYSGATGDKTQTSQGDADYWILKTDGSDIKQWDARFGGSAKDNLLDILVLSDGYLLAGDSHSGVSGDKTQASQGSSDYWVVKTDLYGVKQWDKRFGGSGTELLNCVIKTIDGGFILGGYSESGISGDKTQASQGERDYWIVKINSEGDKEWDKRFGGALGDEMKRIVETADGDLILAGDSYSGTNLPDKTEASWGERDYWIVKTESDGDKIWDKRFGGPADDILWSILPTSDGYLLGGYSSSGVGGDKSQSSQGGYDYWVVKIDESGTKQWDKRFGGSGDEIMFASLENAEQEFILAGYSNSGITGDKSEASQGANDYWIVRIDGFGNKVWDKDLGGSADDKLLSIMQTIDGHYKLAGSSSSGISGDKSQASQGGADYWMLETTSDCIIHDFFEDADGDGYGNPSISMPACIAPSGSVPDNTDCNDANAAVYPGATEICNSIDDNCNAEIDEGVKLTFYADTDGDTYGNLNSTMQACTAPLGYVSDHTDCNDGNAGIYPAALEVCNGIDDDCNITIDDGALNASPQIVWDARFGSSGFDYLESLQQTSDGGYILGGESFSGISGDKTQTSQGLNDYWIVKTGSNGMKQWDARFGGNSTDDLFSLKQTADGGYILGGSSSSGISGDKTQASQGMSDYWIVKTDANGVKQWDSRFGGSNREYFTSLQQTADGGYILGGYSYSGISGDKTQASLGGDDYWIVKTDVGGVKQWDATFGGSGSDALYSLEQTADGGYILGGASNSGISGDKTQVSQGGLDYWIVKINANGVKQWDTRFGGSISDYLYSLQQTSDGGYILGGASISGISGDKTQANQGMSDYWIVKADFNGAKQWDVSFGGIGIDALVSLEQTTDGGYILGGHSNSGIGGDKTQASLGSDDYWIVKTDIIGVKQWDATFGGSGGDALSSLEQTTDGGYILGGYSYSGISGDKTQASWGNTDYWIVKTTGSNIGTAYFLDSDGDGYGNPSITVTACIAPSGYVADDTDCNDANAAIHPGVSDVCNSIDDDCNGVVDQNEITATITPGGSVSTCKGAAITLTANSGPGISYQWLKNNVNISGATNSTYSTSKAASYKVTESNSYSCTSTSMITTLSVIALPEATITYTTLDLCAQSNITLTANGGSGLTYQWLKGGNNVSGATNQTYTTNKKGTYKVIVTNSGGCSKTSAGVTVIKSCKESTPGDDLSNAEMKIFPNPNDGHFLIDLQTEVEETSAVINVFNAIGQRIYEKVVNISEGIIHQEIQFQSGTPDGLYLVEVITNGKVYSGQFINQK